MPYLSDCHSHSFFSPDAHESPEAMCGRAAELNLYAYTLTDHCECHEYEGSAAGFCYAGQSRLAFAEMTALQENLRGRLHFYKGIELGQPMQNLAAAQEVLQRDYDFVLASVHNIRGHEDFYFLTYEDGSEEEIDGILNAYFGEMAEMARWGKFDSLAHMTYPLRYICGEHGIPVNISRHQEKITEIFDLLIRNEKALEINTSGLRQKIGVTLPDLPLLRQYYEQGGRLVTIGSDAHRPEDLGKGIAEGFAVLRQAGFTEFAVYENHKPIMLPLS